MLRAAQFLGVLAALFADAFVLPPPLPATTSLRRRSTVPRVSARSTFSRTDEVSDVPLVSAPQWRGHLHRNGALVFPLGAAWLARGAIGLRAGALRVRGRRAGHHVGLPCCTATEWFARTGCSARGSRTTR